MGQIQAIDIKSVAGNLVSDKDGYLYSYDYENRIVAIAKGDGDATPTLIAAFAYDTQGRRIQVLDAVSGDETRFYYSDNWQVLLETDYDSGVETDLRTFVYGNYIDEVLLMMDNGSDYYYLHDHLYSPAALLDTSGNVVERYEYDAYGKVDILTAAYSPLTYSQYGNPYTFTGRRLDSLDWDATSGEYQLNPMHYRHRAYDTHAGRFMQCDPIGITPNAQLPNRYSVIGQYVDGVNIYQYVNSNLVNYTDPYGLWEIERKRKNWAVATAENGDTFQSLAQQIRLEYSERTKWLKYRNRFVSEGQEAGTGCRYKIPNTVAVYTSKKKPFDYAQLPLVNAFRKMAKSAGDRYAAKNYKVIYKLDQSSENVFVDLWTTDGIFAYAFGGHSGIYEDVWYGFEPEVGTVVSPDQVSPPYKLQAIGSYACGSANEINSLNGTMRWREHVSSTGTYIGYYGAVNWVNVWWNEVSINPGEIPD